MLAPYYTELDLTGDDQVTKADLAVLTDHLGATTASTDWATVSAADIDADGTITRRRPGRVVAADDLRRRPVPARRGVDHRHAGRDERRGHHVGRAHRRTTSTASPPTTARRSTPRRPGARSTRSSRPAPTPWPPRRPRTPSAPSTGMTSMLLGVPIAVKDNYDTKDMPTTGGCGCWDDNQTDDRRRHGHGPARRRRRHPGQGEPGRVRLRLRLRVLVVPARRLVAPGREPVQHGADRRWLERRHGRGDLGEPRRRSASAPTRAARSACRRRTTSSSASGPRSA